MNQALAYPSDAYDANTLKSLSRDFIYMILMVRRGQQAQSIDSYLAQIDKWLNSFESEARSAGYSASTVKDAQYALCAFLDESILKGGAGNIREYVELHPFQYRYFGVHLAGEGFYEKLDSLRKDVSANIDLLELYHLCLALGFEGKYSLENRDQLRYVVNTLGQDIHRYRSAPEPRNDGWKLPDQVGQLLRYEVPLWVYVLLIAVVCLCVYGVLRWWLGSESSDLIEQIQHLFGSRDGR